MSLPKSPENHVRHLFASWFPPLDEFPDGQDGRAFLESEIGKALSDLAHAARGLRQGLNGLALGVGDRSAKEEILSGVHYAIATSSGVVAKVGNAMNPPPPTPRGWQLPPELRPPYSVFWIVLGLGWYVFCLYLFVSSKPTAFSSPLPLMVGIGIAIYIGLLPHVVAHHRWRAGKIPRNYFSEAYSEGPISLRLFIEETLAAAAREIEEVGRRIRHEVYALPFGAANEPAHRELAERLAEADAALAQAAAEFEEITGRKVVLGAARLRDRGERPFDQPRQFEEATVRAMLTDLELMARRGLAALQAASAATEAPVLPNAARHVAELPAQLEGVRARLKEVTSRTMRASADPGTNADRQPWPEIQAVAERAIPSIVSELELALRRLRSEFNAAVAGVANRKALEEIAAVLSRCLADTDAAQANLRALTGQD